MEIINVYGLPIEANVCAQVLRVVEKQPGWSMAHVIMNPLAESLLHIHAKTTEIYIITKGFGELRTGFHYYSGFWKQVSAGSVDAIASNTAHKLRNKSAGPLEHLVITLPPFEQSDVFLLGGREQELEIKPFSLLPADDCFDGAKIIAYPFLMLDLSIAFGWVAKNMAKRGKPHRHNKTSEFLFVVDGSGYIETDQGDRPIVSGDWIRIQPKEKHGLRNEKPEDLIVVCVCSPAFQMDDVS